MEKYLIDEIENSLGIQKLYKFENGYGASVIKAIGSYGYNQGLWEIACIVFENIVHGVTAESDYSLVYDNEHFKDVVGFLTLDQIDEYLEIIKNMEAV